MHHANKLLDFEKNAIEKGYKYIAGVDEVGRGPLAGPLVIGAVILDLERIINLFNLKTTNNDVSDEYTNLYSKINDSKKVTPNNRSIINDLLIKDSICYSIVEISHDFIDKEGISEATNIGFSKAVQQLKISPEYVLTDNFKINNISHNLQKNIIKGDSVSISIAAASIIAKVHRDKYMSDMDNIYPQYGFSRHKGYGTSSHILAIKQYGICKIHRKSFEPIKSWFFN